MIRKACAAALVLLVCLLFATGCAPSMNDPDSTIIATVSPQPLSFREWVMAFPKRLMSAPTGELLEGFLQTTYMSQSATCHSTFEAYYRENDFSDHAAFCELISRKDCLKVLEKYAKSILSGEKSDLEKACFDQLLLEGHVKSLLESAPGSKAYPNLQELYARLSETIAGYAELTSG